MRQVYQGEERKLSLTPLYANERAILLLNKNRGRIKTPCQTTATRPLAIRKNGTWFTYGWDLTKNVCEVFGAAGRIRTA